MSSDPRSDAPSPAAEAPESELGLGELLRIRGAPLLEALEGHRPGSLEHAESTAAYAFATAVDLGYVRAQSEVAREAAKLHEVGQVYVPADVLAKAPIERNRAEAEAFAAHYEAGYRLARGAGVPEYVCAWLLRTRETFDGQGPEGLTADAIPIESRIIRAACACATALAAPAVAGQAPHRRALQMLEAEAGRELDPRVAVTLRTVLERAVA
jgi:HD-GYP domain-containing protein (c-di-GMP phosphodiesterase class II)